MRKLVAAGLVLTCLWAASPTFADFNSDVTLKVGASGLFNHRMVSRRAIVGLRQAGAHISVDFAVPKWVVALSPFLDVYHRAQEDAVQPDRGHDTATNMIGGVNFLFTGPRNDRATMYFGVGGGVAHMKVATDVVVPVATTAYKNRLMADALIGLEVKIGPKISLFLEPHYVWTTKMLNGLTAHAGLAFPLSRAEAAPPPVRPAAPVYTPPKPPAPKAPAPLKKVEEIKAPSPEPLDMAQMIYFAHDQSDINDQAKAILNDKVSLFRSTPGLRIRIVGFASQPGTDEYNMALGMRRAVAAKAYLVSQGVDETRIEIATRGEGQLAVAGPGEVVDAQNRRDQFQILLAEPPAAPKR